MSLSSFEIETDVADAVSVDSGVLLGTVAVSFIQNGLVCVLLKLLIFNSPFDGLIQTLTKLQELVSLLLDSEYLKLNTESNKLYYFIYMKCFKHQYLLNK